MGFAPRIVCAGGMLMLTVVAVPALAQDAYSILRTACADKLGADTAACECIVDTAKRTLNTKETALVVAAAQEDQAALERARQGMTGPETMNAVNFFTKTPAACGVKK